VLAALRMDAGRLRVPRTDGDREALRILLVARQEIRAAATAQPAGCMRCCWPGTAPTARGRRRALTGTVLAALARA